MQPGDILSWAEVSAIHRVRWGIYHRSGKLISLLTDFGLINPYYPDTHGASPDTVYYTGSGRRGDQKLDPANRALLSAVDSGHAVPLFNKLAVGRWQFTGMWTVVDGCYVHDEGTRRMVWRFTLKKAGPEGC